MYRSPNWLSFWSRLHIVIPKKNVLEKWSGWWWNWTLTGSTRHWRAKVDMASYTRFTVPNHPAIRRRFVYMSRWVPTLLNSNIERVDWGRHHSCWSWNSSSWNLKFPVHLGTCISKECSRKMAGVLMLESVTASMADLTLVWILGTSMHYQPVFC